MNELNKAELRRLAEATGGITWEASHAVSHAGERRSRAIYHYPTPFHCVEIVETPDTDTENGESIHDESSWAFIGAANPASVLSLLNSEAKAKCEAGHAIQQKDAAYEKCNHLRSELDAALAELEACRKDAEMYRQIRDGSGWPAVFDNSDDPEPLRGDDLDAAMSRRQSK